MATVTQNEGSRLRAIAPLRRDVILNEVVDRLGKVVAEVAECRQYVLDTLGEWQECRVCHDPFPYTPDTDICLGCVADNTEPPAA